MLKHHRLELTRVSVFVVMISVKSQTPLISSSSSFVLTCFSCFENSLLHTCDTLCCFTHGSEVGLAVAVQLNAKVHLVGDDECQAVRLQTVCGNKRVKRGLKGVKRGLEVALKEGL